MEQGNHLGDSCGADVWPSLGAVDPSEVRLPVELGERVEEIAGRRILVEGISNIVGEMNSLRTFGMNGDLDIGP